jgi:hypothetical protein
MEHAIVRVCRQARLLYQIATPERGGIAPASPSGAGHELHLPTCLEYAGTAETTDERLKPTTKQPLLVDNCSTNRLSASEAMGVPVIRWDNDAAIARGE